MTVLADGRCRFLGAATTAADGTPARAAGAGDVLAFAARFACDETLSRPSVELELRTHTGRLLLSRALPALDGDLAPGQTLVARGAIELGGDAGDDYATFVLRDGAGRARLRAVNALALVRLPGAGGSLSADGMLSVEPGEARATPATAVAPEPVGDWPALLHVTHWKAGSQWLHKMFMGLAAALEAEHGIRDVRVPPPFAPSQMLGQTIAAGRLYPTLYLTRRQFETLKLPAGKARPFVVIRDPRDALVSAYFSQAFSHPTMWSEDIRINRARLAAMDREAGLLYLLERFLPACADIQWSWLNAGVPVLRYRDLLGADVERLVPLFTEYGELPLSRETVAGIVEACRFEKLTGGRARGQEDVAAHERRGEAGDWRRHFTPRLTAAFKALYGDLLIATGYEVDDSWQP